MFALSPRHLAPIALPAHVYSFAYMYILRYICARSAHEAGGLRSTFHQKPPRNVLFYVKRKKWNDENQRRSTSAMSIDLYCTIFMYRIYRRSVFDVKTLCGCDTHTYMQMEFLGECISLFHARVIHYLFIQNSRFEHSYIHIITFIILFRSQFAMFAH